MFFVLTIPIGKEEMLKHQLEKKVNLLFHTMTKKKQIFTGKLASDYARNLPKGNMGGLGKYCLDKGKGDAELAAKIMTKQIFNH